MGTKKKSSMEYYKDSPETYAVKMLYDSAYQKQPEVKEYQSELKKKKPAGPGKNNAHTGNGDETVVKDESENKANNRPKVRQTTANGMNKPEKLGTLYRKFNTQETKDKRKKRKERKKSY
jgi:hypothetical protein